MPQHVELVDIDVLPCELDLVLKWVPEIHFPYHFLAANLLSSWTCVPQHVELVDIDVPLCELDLVLKWLPRINFPYNFMAANLLSSWT